MIPHKVSPLRYVDKREICSRTRKDPPFGTHLNLTRALPEGRNAYLATRLPDKMRPYKWIDLGGGGVDRGCEPVREFSEILDLYTLTRASAFMRHHRA